MIRLCPSPAGLLLLLACAALLMACPDSDECVAPADCDDGNTCTEDRCALGRCSHLVTTYCCHERWTCTDPDRPVCRAAIGRCVECAVNADCPPRTNPALGTCDTATGWCAQCLDDTGCAAAERCNRATRKCEPRTEVPGLACTAAAQCESGTCLTEAATGAPGGVCASFCSADRLSCPGASEACVYTLSPFIQGRPLCLPTFTGGACRAGYTPLVALDLATQQAVGVCQPACQEANCSQAACNVYSGLCLGEASTGAENGAPCAAHTDCKGLCLSFWPNGYCTSPCVPSGAACPDGGGCINLGLHQSCGPSCASDVDCRAAEGYVCNPGIKICLPP